MSTMDNPILLPSCNCTCPSLDTCTRASRTQTPSHVFSHSRVGCLLTTCSTLKMEISRLCAATSSFRFILLQSHFHLPNSERCFPGWHSATPLRQTGILGGHFSGFHSTVENDLYAKVGLFPLMYVPWTNRSPRFPAWRKVPEFVVQITQLQELLMNLLGSSHLNLMAIVRYYFLHPSKQLRPLLVLL